jgi:hypothetical protein
MSSTDSHKMFGGVRFAGCPVQCKLTASNVTAEMDFQIVIEEKLLS